MKFVELKKSLQENIKCCYLIYGEDTFLCEKSIALILNALNMKKNDFDYTKVENEDFDINYFKSIVNQYPLISSKKVIQINNLAKLSLEQKEVIKNYLSNPFEKSILIFYFTESNDAVINFIKTLNNVTNIDCNRIDLKTIFNLVKITCKQKNKQITDEAVNKLILFCNSYLTKIMNEVDKLINYSADKETIEEADIEKLVTKDEEYQIFELFEALSRKDSNKVYKILESFLQIKGQDVMVLPLMINYFRRVFLSKISNLDNKTLASYFNVKEYAIIKSKQQSQNFSSMKLKDIYELLIDYDYKIKSGSCTTKNALYIVIGKILNN